MPKCMKCGNSFSVLTSDLGSGLCRECAAKKQEDADRQMVTGQTYCKHCHKEVSPEAKACPHCGQPDPAEVRMQRVPDYGTWAWLVTFLCCWPLGIPAIVNANRARKQAAAGVYQEAMKAAQRARAFCWWSFAMGLVCWGIIVLSIISIARS
jgi:hypothetical protein